MNQSICIARELLDVEHQKDDREMRKFVDSAFSSKQLSVVDSSSPCTLDCEATSLLGILKDEVDKLLTPTHHYDYRVTYNQIGVFEKGKEVSAEKEEEKTRYFREICDVVAKALGDKVLFNSNTFRVNSARSKKVTFGITEGHRRSSRRSHNT